MKNAWLNGQFLPLQDAKVSVLDRAFLFGDAVYEMMRVVQGKFFLLPEHRARLERGLEEMRITGVDFDTLLEAARALLQGNGWKDANLYLQITRGVAPTRKHSFPDPAVVPTQFLYVQPFKDSLGVLRENGGAVVSFPELRWGRCCIKSTNLLGNVFAAQAAKEADAVEAVFVNDRDEVTEGSHTNFFAVIDGKLRTMPKGDETLPGITRELVLKLAISQGIPVEEKAVKRSEVARASELLLTGTSTEVFPVVTWDGQRVGDGKPGPVGRKLQSAYQEFVKKYPHSRVELGMGA